MPPLIPIQQSSVNPVVDRVVSAAIILIAAAMVLLLLSVSPDDRGHGTHEQLGMSPCSWAQGPDGFPCPTCGVTTAASHLVHLQPLQAVATQPFGAALALAGLALAVLALGCLVGRKSFLDFLAWLPYGSIVVGFTVLLLLSWGYKYLTFHPQA